MLTGKMFLICFGIAVLAYILRRMFSVKRAYCHECSQCGGVFLTGDKEDYQCPNCSGGHTTEEMLEGLKDELAIELNRLEEQQQLIDLYYQAIAECEAKLEVAEDGGQTEEKHYH